MSAGGGSGSRGGVWIVGALVLGVVVFAVLAMGEPSGEPFDVRSPAPDGYKALSILLGDRGADVDRRTALGVVADPPGPGEVLVVPAPDRLSQRERDAVLDAARRGAVVVLGDEGGPIPDDVDDPFPSSTGVGFESPDALAETPAEPVDAGDCTIAELADIGPVDGAFARFPVASRERDRCFEREGEPGSLVVRERIGEGTLITLASPYLWANARLQPDKENGGEPLANAAMALRLLGPTADGATVGTSITFVDAVASPGVTVEGEQGPLDLLPLGVKLAIVQLVAAFVLYAWWRARRLGHPVTERTPVRIAGSELVAAIGDLLRRHADPRSAAETLRARTRRDLALRLGLPADAPAEVLVGRVADRCGRDPAEITSTLYGAPVSTAEGLVQLTNSIDAIRQEVLDGQPVR